MRTTLSQQVQSSLMFVSDSSKKLVDAQNHTASGKRIMRPSDDVPGTNRALSLRSAINTVEQYANNIDVSKPQVQASASAVADLVKAVQRVQTIAIGAINSAKTKDAHEANIKELDGILSQIADIANTKHIDQYLFSGTATGTPPLQAQAGAQPFAYAGNSGVRQTQVLSWVSMQTNIPGDKLFNFNGEAGADTTDLFTMVKQVRDTIKTGIDSGNMSAVGDHLENIESNLDNLLTNSAQLGSWLARMDNASGVLSDTQDRLKMMLSETEDIDLPQAVVELKTQENIYQSALAITSRMLDLSLASLKYS